MASSSPVQRLTDDALWARVARQARCADSGLDPDQWYPVSTNPAQARHEAATAIVICTSCPVRAQCLELSLRHWDTGQHGVWGGLIATDRARLRRRRRPGDADGAEVVVVAVPEPAISAALGQVTGLAGHAARHLARTDPGHLYRGHDLWNVGRKFVCEGQPRVTT